MLRLNSDAFAWRDLDGTVVALHLATSRYQSIKDSGSLLWYALLDGCTREHLTDVLVERYAVDRARADADVDAFLVRLQQLGGLVEEPA